MYLTSSQKRAWRLSFLSHANPISVMTDYLSLYVIWSDMTPSFLT
jgi:hypothetical protein